jgi:thiol:disulfide interchange protein
VITLAPEAGWHLYAPASSAESGVGQGKPTIVAAGPADSAAVLSVAATQSTPAGAAELAAAGAVEGPVTLEVTLSSTSAVSAAGKPVELVVGFQTCSDRTCDAPTAVRLSILAPEGAADAEVTFTAARYGEAAQAPLPIVTAVAPGAVRPGTDPGSVVVASRGTADAASTALSLPLALLMGLVGGLILNLMPCVLPVLGLKLMSFAQQSGQARRDVFLMNLWYCAGVFAVFFVLATASVAANIGLASTNLGWGQQFGSVPFKIGMLGVVFAFALSFLGVWELPIPGFIGEKAGHVQSREGPLGSFLKGVLSTVLATPCSGPYLGTVFGYTLTQPTAVTYAVFGAIALGMSLPYIVVGLFPGLVRFLPRPGAWMATFKELLGFVMLGTVAYLFYLLRQQHEWFVATFVMLVGIWLGCWWAGRAQESRGSAGFGRWVQAVAMGAVVGSAAFFMLGPHESLIPWEKPFSTARLAELRGSGSTVLVDFSADWCPTCKLNLASAIETSKVKAALEKNHVVPVLADWSDGSDEIRRVLESLGSRSIPLLAIYPAAKPGASLPEPIILRDLLTESQVLDAIERAGPSCCPPPEIRAAAGPAAPGR